MKTTVLNVRLQPELVEQLDQLVAAGIFPSRSEAIREFARDYINEHAQ
jgi:metal-responsive CopG/Arc/MetJ family transcriptional regulator